MCGEDYIYKTGSIKCEMDDNGIVNNVYHIGNKSTMNPEEILSNNLCIERGKCSDTDGSDKPDDPNSMLNKVLCGDKMKYDKSKDNERCKGNKCFDGNNDDHDRLICCKEINGMCGGNFDETKDHTCRDGYVLKPNAMDIESNDLEDDTVREEKCCIKLVKCSDTDSTGDKPQCPNGYTHNVDAEDKLCTNVPCDLEDETDRDICCKSIDTHCFNNANESDDVVCAFPLSNRDWTCNCIDGISSQACRNTECGSIIKKEPCEENINCEVNEPGVRLQGADESNAVETCCGVSGLCYGNDDRMYDHVCPPQDGPTELIEQEWTQLNATGTRWENISLGKPLPSGTSDQDKDKICCETPKHCFPDFNLPPCTSTRKNLCLTTEGECIMSDRIPGCSSDNDTCKGDILDIEKRKNTVLDNVEINDENIIQCCDMSNNIEILQLSIDADNLQDINYNELVNRSDNVEGFTNNNYNYNNNTMKFLTNTYSIEGIDNKTNNIKRDCRIIKSELINELAINDDQIVIDCKFAKENDKYLIKVYFISNEENPLPEGLNDKLKEGINIQRLGIKVTPTVVTGLEDEEKSSNKTSLIILIISILISIILGGIYMFNK